MMGHRQAEQAELFYEFSLERMPPRGCSVLGKTAVVGAVRRKGNVVARVVDKVNIATIERFVAEAVSTKFSLVCTDNFSGYHWLRWHAHLPHNVVDHAKGQHVVGAVHTNTIEGFWSLIKRGVMGTFHKVSRKYLPLYVEYQLRSPDRLLGGSAIA